VTRRKLGVEFSRVRSASRDAGYKQSNDVQWNVLLF
jgi:hypothetical protein